MNSEKLKLIVQETIKTRKGPHQNSVDIGTFHGTITCRPLNFTDPAWKPVCRLSPSMMNRGMTIEQWNHITTQLNSIM